MIYLIRKLPVVYRFRKMKAKMVYTGIRVKDLEESIKFYTQVMGMMVRGRSKIPAARGSRRSGQRRRWTGSRTELLRKRKPLRHRIHSGRRTGSSSFQSGQPR